MSVYTKDEIRAKIIGLDAKIDKAEDQQVLTSGGPGAGMHSQRGDLRAMYQERERWIKEWEKLEIRETGASKTLARFPRPL